MIRKLILHLTGIAAILALISFCSDTDTLIPDDRSGMWSATAKGNGEEIGAYPDLYSNYWEYTYDLSRHSDKVLKFTGEFPHCRYFSFSIYDDDTGSAIGGMDDASIEPDEGSVNPFRSTTSHGGRFTMYLVPEKLADDFIVHA